MSIFISNIILIYSYFIFQYFYLLYIKKITQNFYRKHLLIIKYSTDKGYVYRLSPQMDAQDVT